MRKLILAARNRLLSIIHSFSITEKIFFYLFLLVGLASLVSYLYLINQSYMREIPRTGGSFREGFVGIPRFINPVLATTDTDRELSSLVFAGLTRADTDGKFIPAMAESYTVSDDGTIYTFKLREDAAFHDGSPLRAADVVYTIALVQDPAVKSPRRAQWDGITVTEVDPLHVQFTLKQPYSAFVTNTSIGILPRVLWEDVSAEEFPYSNFNLHPIGSGPYEVNSVSLNSNGLVENIDFRSYSNFTLGKAYISNIHTIFFPNEEARIQALIQGEIDTAGNLSESSANLLKERNINLVESPLHRLFGIFFNQNIAPVLLHHEIREALNQAVDKKALVNEILSGFGTPIDSPIPEFSNLFSSLSKASDGTEGNIVNTEEILSTLADFGWQKNAEGILEKKGKSGSEKLIFSIYTSDNEDLKATAKRVSEMWNQIGAIVDVKVFEPAQFNLGVIRPRKYDALLFGITVGRDLDYYAFWHSSQRIDPGLNIALYTNPKTDKLLSQARTETDPLEKQASEEAFALEVMRDVPAVFLYSPHFIYAMPDNIYGYEASSLRAPGDRFYDVYKWYINTDTVWNIFTKN